MHPHPWEEPPRSRTEGALRAGCHRVQDPANVLAAVVHSHHRRPPDRSARARPTGRAQQAEPDRRAGEETTQVRHASAGAAGGLILCRGLFGNIGWGTECAQGTGAIGGRLPAMSTCSPYAGALLPAGCCEPQQGQTADIDHRAD
jgi:hypothetical protein